jgi:hypothetical protein
MARVGPPGVSIQSQEHDPATDGNESKTGRGRRGPRWAPAPPPSLGRSVWQDEGPRAPKKPGRPAWESRRGGGPAVPLFLAHSPSGRALGAGFGPRNVRRLLPGSTGYRLMLVRAKPTSPAPPGAATNMAVRRAAAPSEDGRAGSLQLGQATFCVWLEPRRYHINKMRACSEGERKPNH